MDIRFKLNIQLFGGEEQPGVEGNGGAGEGDQGGEKGKEGQEQETKVELPKSQEEFEAAIAKALEGHKSQWEKDYETKLQKAKEEGEKLAKMTDDEKAELERKQKEEVLTKREAEIMKRELKSQAKETLTSKKLPAELADLLNYENEDVMKKSMATVEKIFAKAVETEVNTRLGGETPAGGGKGEDGKDDISKQFSKALNGF